MNNEADVLKALQHLEQRLTATFNAGIAEVKAQMSDLQAEHNRALLDQERRNSTFATRDRVESIAANVHDRTNHALTLEGRIHRLERDVTALSKTVNDNEHEHQESSVTGLKAQLGYLATGGAVVGGTILGFILNHLK